MLREPRLYSYENVTLAFPAACKEQSGADIPGFRDWLREPPHPSTRSLTNPWFLPRWEGLEWGCRSGVSCWFSGLWQQPLSSAAPAGANEGWGQETAQELRGSYLV